MYIRRRRELIKYIAVFCTLCILYGILIGSSNDTIKAKISEEIINKIVRRVEEQAKFEKESVEDNKEKDKNKDDFDHPEEERKKAVEQLKNLEGKIQLNAPLVHDMSAPGI